MTHTNVRATYAVTETLSAVAAVNNGWNYSSLSTSGSKTGEVGEVGLAWTPSKTFALAAEAYVVKDPVLDAQKTLLDAVATYNTTSALTLVLSVDWGEQKQHTSGDSDLNWNGTAFYTNYALNDQWLTSSRLEYLDDKQRFVTGTGDAQTLKEGALTFGYDPVKSFELRMEVIHIAGVRRGEAATPTF